MKGLDDLDVVRTLSASQIRTLYNCERKWAWEKLEGIDTPQNYDMAKGTYLHAIVEDFNKALGDRDGRSKKDLREDSKELILATAKDVFTEFVENGWLKDEFREQLEDESDELKRKMMNHVKGIMNHYSLLKNRNKQSEDNAWENARPDSSEFGATLIDPTGNWAFVGGIDAIYEKSDIWWGKTALIDYKTGSAPFDSNDPMDVHASRQLDLYAWLFWQVHGVVPDVSGIRYLDEGPESASAYWYQENDRGTVEQAHLMFLQNQVKTQSWDVEDYPKNEDYQYCHVERDEGEDIKCPHWDYCLGPEEVPGEKDHPFNGRGMDNVEVRIKDPREHDLTLASNAEPVLQKHSIVPEDEDDEATSIEF